MRKIIIYFICHLCYFSNAQTVEWVNTVGGLGYDGSTSLISDSLGNAYVVGNFRKTIDIDPGIGTLNFISSNDTSLYIQKLNSDGKLIWAQQINYALADQIEFDKQGNLLILGSFRGNVDIDPSIGVFNIIGQNRENLFLLKLDSNGNFIWATVAMRNCLDCYGGDMTIDKDNNIVITGNFRGSVDIDPTSLTFTLTSFNTNQEDAFVVKYNSIGNLVWGKVFRGPNFKYGEAIVTDTLGNVYIAGTFHISADFNPGPGSFIMTSLVGYGDAFIVKLNPNGIFVWAKETNNSSNGFLFIYDIGLDKNQNLILVGVFEKIADFDFGPSTNIKNSSSSADFYVLQLDINANFKWVKTFNSTNYDYAGIIYIDKNNDYFVSGQFYGDIDVISNKPVLQSRGNSDSFVVKMDDVGNPIYAKSIGGIESEYLSSLSVSNGSLYVTGFYSETAYFDCHSITSNGFSDSFTAKISDCEVDYTFDTISACDTYTWIDGIVYTESRDSILFYTLNRQCCDSIVELNLTLHNSDNEFINIIANDEYEWNDSIYNTTGNYVEVYTNRNGCDSTIHVNLFIIQDEICNNSIDDDLDGYVDSFDPDCPCDDTAYQSQCKPLCELVPDSFPNIKMKMKWESENLTELSPVASSYAVADIDNDGVSEIVTVYGMGGRNSSKNYTAVLHGATGILLDTFRIFKEYTFGELLLHPAIGKSTITNNIYTYMHSLGDIISLDVDGNEIFRTNYPLKYSSGIVGLSDFNHDGHPEVYTGSVVFDGQTGNVLYTGKNKDCGNDDCVQIISVAADVLGNDGKPELITGRYVHQIEINILKDTIGNIANIIEAPAGVTDGKCSVADMDGDGLLEIIVVESNNVNLGILGKLSVWNPRTGILMAQVQNPSLPGNSFDGSMPFVGDVDGDCIPEIGVVYNQLLRMYKYNPSSSALNILYTINTTDKSGTTGITMFDFNQDGKQELVYRDETYLRILEGATGITIDSFQLLSNTWNEYPVIADIDNNGQAEIIISGSRVDVKETRLYCFESASAPWAPARSVWNQYAYNPTQVNDDLTIPRYQQNAAAFFDTDSCAQFTCSQPYNNFMAQATYRSQEGCVVWPSSDVSLYVWRYECNADSLIFYLIVGNEGDKNITVDTMDLSIYATIPDMIASPLDRRTINLSRDADGKVSRSDTIRLALAMPNTDIKSLLFRINDAGLGDAYSVIHGLSPTLECDYENNSAVIDIDISTRTLDLGPDILKCRTEVITLDAGSSFVSYLWNDLSEDTLFSTSEAGVYSLTATDQCGRNYQDTVTLTIDESLKPNLGPDILLCEGDTTTISVGNEFTWVKWYPEEMVSCDTCFSTLVIADSTFNLVLTTNKFGCVDADTIAIDVKDLPRSEKQTSICAGTSIDFYGVEIADAGRYEHRLGQCDSLIILDVTLLKIDSTLLSEEICIGDSIKIHNTWQYQSGIYTESFMNSNGCDSTSIVTLGVAPYLLENDSLSICEGDSIIVNGQMVYTAGLYVDTLSVDGSCQKIMTTQVSLINRTEESIMLTLCPDSSATVGNLVIDESGTFTIDLTSQAGCDSTLNILANKLTWPQPPITSINCKDEQYTATWIPQAPWNIEWSDGSIDTIYRQEEGGTLMLRSYTDGCEKVFEYDLPPIPKLSDIPQLSDQLVKGSVSLPLSVDLDEVSWTIEWSPAHLFSCANCFDTEVTTNTDATITVSMTHESGCSFEQQFRIIREVKSEISVPNIFNPTSTGGNNLWIVTLPTGSLVAEVYIYDRWGNQVFTSKNENQMMWDGNYQGKALSTGVYVYHVKVIDGDGKISMLYGDVTLVR